MSKATVVRAPVDKPVLAANAASRMAGKDPKRALKWIEGALAEFPGHAALIGVQADLWRKSVPSWHLPMMNDTLRNGAYRQALEKVIQPGTRVFEIGTGAGLLAMMAARAGATHVVTCEANERIADVARQVIQQNGYSDTITVIARKSTEVTLEDIGGPCHLLLTETFDATLVGEGCLSSIKHARQNFLSSQGLICPTRGWIKAQPVQRSVESFDLSKPIDGFDVSAFSQFGPKGIPLKSDDPKVTPIGDAVKVIEFDFNSDFDLSPCELTVTFNFDETVVDGIAFWMGLELASGVIYECPPGEGLKSHWGHILVLKPPLNRLGVVRTVRAKVVIDVDIFQAWFVLPCSERN